MEPTRAASAVTRGLVRLLGEQHVTHIAADDYHRFYRKRKVQRYCTRRGWHSAAGGG
jgi:uridine kinase